MAQIAPKALQYLDSFLRSIDIRTQHHNKKGKAKMSQWKLLQVKRDDGASTLVEKYFDVLNVDILKHRAKHPSSWNLFCKVNGILSR